MKIPSPSFLITVTLVAVTTAVAVILMNAFYG